MAPGVMTFCTVTGSVRPSKVCTVKAAPHSASARLMTCLQRQRQHQQQQASHAVSSLAEL
jgi:hypothetical protein